MEEGSTGFDDLNAIDAGGTRSNEAEERATRTRLPGAIWFKGACAISWLTVIFTFIAFVASCVAIGGVQTVAREICMEPELVTASQNITCPRSLACFADCVDAGEIMTSMHMRTCFLGGDGSAAISNASDPMDATARCTYTAATVAYTLAQRYRGSIFPAESARDLLREQIVLETSRRRQLASGDSHGSITRGSLTGGATALLGQGPALPLAALRLLPKVLAGDVAAVVLEADERAPFTHAEATGARTLAEMTSDEGLREAYANLAAGSVIALIVDGTLSHIYGWFAFISILVTFAGCTAL